MYVFILQPVAIFFGYLHMAGWDVIFIAISSETTVQFKLLGDEMRNFGQNIGQLIDKHNFLLEWVLNFWN